MPRLRYDGRRKHVLNAFGKTLQPGDEDDFTDSEARALLGTPTIRVSVVETVESTVPPRTGAGSSRDVWAAYAADRGIDPDGLTRDEIIAAVDAAGQHDDAGERAGEPEAPDAGVGQPDTDEQEE